MTEKMAKSVRLQTKQIADKYPGNCFLTALFRNFSIEYLYSVFVAK